MRAYFLLSLASLAISISPSQAQKANRQPVDWVNESIGTANEGQTFPATGPPFAMTQWTPQTRAGNIKCVPPYYFADTRIQGFRASHFLSGSCTQDYGSMDIMPISLPLGATPKLTPDARASAFDRASEVATPYRYAVTLSDYGIDAELTGTTRSGILRFRFNKPGQSLLLIEANSAANEGTVHIDIAAQEVTVITPARRIYAGSGKAAGFSGCFTLRFDHPFHLGGTWAGSTTYPGSDSQTGTRDSQTGTAGLPGAYISFDLKPGDTVTARVGSSFTSLDEARHNLAAEIPDFGFDHIALQTKSAWSKALDTIQIKAPDTQKHILYTAMYHAMLLPRIVSDVSGTYPAFGSGTEGLARIATAKGFTYYDDYSLWDTFRAVHPLFTLLDPDRERDMVKSLLAKGDEGGFLPIYPAWGSYTSEMIGDHADAVIVDAWAKGIRGFDLNAAYRLMRHNAIELPDRALYLDGRGRRGLDSYLKYGYIPLEDHIPEAFHKNEQVSRTLEYAYDDSLVATLAKALNKPDDATLFAHRAQNYRNVIDPGVGFARGRHTDGTWITPFEPTQPATYVTEGLPIQYTFFVLQDIPGLIALVGGKAPFIAKLDTLFDGNFYDHGNEPSHHIAYLYDNAGAAWKTQLRVRNVLDTQYKDDPSGLAGNDDCGQMSAWYIFSALGFYPVSPGTPRYQIGSPLFDSATLHLPSGRQLHISAKGASAGFKYIQSATLNGAPLNRSWLTHAELLAGGNLIFRMSTQPNKSWPTKN